MKEGPSNVQRSYHGTYAGSDLGEREAERWAGLGATKLVEY